MKIDCTGDVCVGDTIFFQEVIWGGTYRKPKAIGTRDISAKVLRDSYGVKKQQHTFSLEVISCNTEQEENNILYGKVIKRKGRNIYRSGTERLLWKDEQKRDEVLSEKHDRGNNARQLRDKRHMADCCFE